MIKVGQSEGSCILFYFAFFSGFFVRFLLLRIQSWRGARAHASFFRIIVAVVVVVVVVVVFVFEVVSNPYTYVCTILN